MKLLYLLVTITTTFYSCAIQREIDSEDDSRVSGSYTPDGILEVVYQTGKLPSRTFVYLPEDYYTSQESYPTVYLLHGARGDESSWITEGNLLRSVDSLQHHGLLCDCIVVTPDMNRYKDSEDYQNRTISGPLQTFMSLDGSVEEGFCENIVAVIDSLYRTIPEKEYRAIAGLSIGGLQTIHISASNPDVFGYVGIFSPMTHKLTRTRGRSEFYRKLRHRQAEQFSEPPYVYTIMTGKRDLFYSGILRYRDNLVKKGYPVTLYISFGGHDWSNWEKYSCMFFRQIFRNAR